jgi:hypothetical protein
MKNFLVFLGLFVFIGILSGCGDQNSTTTTASSTSLQELNKTGTLQGTIYDAVTGDRIGGSDLRVFLIQGSQNRTPSRLNTGSTDPLMGEYAFTDIPVTFADYYNFSPYNQNTTYKVVVIKPGYQRFEAEFTLGGVFPIDSNGNPVPGVVEAAYNRIGNIFLFPLGTTSGDVKVYVYDSFKTPIPDAVVYLNQDNNNNSTTVNTDNVCCDNTDSDTDRLYDTTGLIANLSATTDSTGMATFPSTDLTLGGYYRPIVPGLSFQGVQLATNYATSFTVGSSAQTRVITMSAISSTLYVISASNQVPGTITASGVLTINFSQPIILSTTDFPVTITDPDAVGVVTTPVTGVLSNGGSTLTLTPDITTAPTGAGSFVTYSYAGTIYLANSQTPTAYTLFGGGTPVLNITTGSTVSGIVQLLSH